MQVQWTMDTGGGADAMWTQAERQRHDRVPGGPEAGLTGLASGAARRRPDVPAGRRELPAGQTVARPWQLWVLFPLIAVCGAVWGQNAVAIESASVSLSAKAITVGVNVDVAVDLCLLDLEFGYDAGRLELAESQVVVEPSRLAPGAASNVMLRVGDGTVKWTAACFDGSPIIKAGSGPLLRLDFRIKDACPLGPTPLVWATADGFSGQLDKVAFPTRLDGAVTVTPQVFYTLRYQDGLHGRVTGEALQTVEMGQDGTAVGVAPDPGFFFDQWSDGVKENPRTDRAVAGDLTVTALYAAAAPVDPVGVFALHLPGSAFTGSAAVWDFSGHYETTLGGNDLTLNLQHDAKGKITGTGAFVADVLPKAPVGVALVAKGSAKGSGGSLSVKLGVKGAATGIPGDPAAKVKVSITQALTLGAGPARLVGTSAVSAAFGPDSNRFSANTELTLPAGADGSYDIVLHLGANGKGIMGTGLIQLANGTEHMLLVKGKRLGTQTSLQITGDKALDPGANGISLKAVVETLADGTARVVSIAGKAFGQAIAWQE